MPDCRGRLFREGLTVLWGSLTEGVGFFREGLTVLLPDRLDLKILPVASLLPVLLHDTLTPFLHSYPLLGKRLGLSSVVVGVCGSNCVH